MLPDCSKLAINQKKDSDITIFGHDVIIKFFDDVLLLLLLLQVSFQYHHQFWIMTIFFYKRLTRNPKSEISPSEFCPISSDWNEVGIPNLARMSLMP